MHSQKSFNLSNDNAFKILYEFLMEGQENRRELLSSPKETLNKLGLEMDKKSLDELMKLSEFNINKKKTGFNEKLVLCSSSGY